MKLIVGLGNVGRPYAATRHNLGFMVVRRLAARHHIRVAHRYLSAGHVVARYGDWTSDKGLVRLMLPQTMMNRSGEALAAISAWRVAWRHILLVSDDVNLPLGVLRLRPEGSAGGHKGLESCLASLGTDEVPRLRIGIGIQPPAPDLVDFVLSRFRAEERTVIQQAVAGAVAACELWATEGIDAAMNRVNPILRLQAGQKTQ